MPRYATTHQYEPLRTPSGWGAEGKRLIVQLTQIFDDIYRRYGRLGVKDVGESFQGLLTELRQDVDGKATAAALGQTNEAVAAKLNKADVVNSLTETEAGKALDARQGKALDGAKLDKTSVVNGLTETEAGKALDARQGKALDEAKLNKADVVNSLTETEAGKALDARQGKALLLAAWPVDSVYLTAGESDPAALFGGTWEQTASAMTGMSAWRRMA